MKTKIENSSTKSLLLKKFHTLCSVAKLSFEMKEEIINAFGCESSKDMSVQDLIDSCKMLEERVKPNNELDKWRKRLMAAIGGYLKKTGGENNAANIKSIACRASGYKDINDIPRERIINLYYAFVNKQKDFSKVDGFVFDDLLTKSILN